MYVLAGPWDFTWLISDPIKISEQNIAYGCFLVQNLIKISSIVI